jgi:hypothetical protein
MVEKAENEDVQASIMAQGNSETICVSVETPKNIIISTPSKQKVRKP